MFYCLDKLIAGYNLTPPFLDVGCGTGDLSSYLAKKGWEGKAIDFSDTAIATARDKLRRFPRVVVEKNSLTGVSGFYSTVFLWDVLEHIADDEAALLKVSLLLRSGGYVLASVPSNPREWRWDDTCYGHYRRYTVDEIRVKMTSQGLEVVMLWDFTYPFFWMMRRAYTRIMPPPEINSVDKEVLTKDSCKLNAWDISILSGFLDGLAILWWPFSRLQFLLFRNRTTQGHEMFVLARKSGAAQ